MKGIGQLLIGLGLCLCIPAFAGIEDGLIAHYAFEGSADDSTTNHLNGTLHNASFVEGHAGLGLRVYGQPDSYVEVPGSPLLSPQDEVTVSLWVKVMSPPPIHSGVIYKAAIEPTANGFQDRSYTLWVRSEGTAQIASTPEGAFGQVYCNTPAGAVPFGQFVHLVGIVSARSNRMVLYVNGREELSCNYPGSKIRTGDYPLRIGAPFFTLSDQNPLNGVVDEVRIYGRALDAGEVRELFSLGNARLSIAVSQVRLCWFVPEGKLSQLQYRLSLTGSPWVDLGPPTAGFGTNFCTTDEVSSPARLYRVVYLP